MTQRSNFITLLSFFSFSFLLSITPCHAAGIAFTLPPRTDVASGAFSPLEPAPVGVSFEFFAFPAYFTNVSSTLPCLQNWQTLTGVWPPIRIGGTTQDRATFVADQAAFVNYTVANEADAPAELTYGGAFLSLAAMYAGSVVMGLNRGKNDMANTIAAAKETMVRMAANVLAIELGNEPEYWRSSQPIALAAGVWDAAADARSQAEWDLAVGSALSADPATPHPIIQAGNSLNLPPGWGAAELIAASNDSVRAFVRDYAHHNYPGGSVAQLMSHARISSNLGVFAPDVAAAQSVGKQYVLGETNSVAGGGAARVSPTFGAALWTLDYAVTAAWLNISRSYFHQGTVGNCQYCFWGRTDIGAPYYGATAAVAFLAGAAHVTRLDDGKSNYAGYAVYDAAGNPLRVMLYNSDFYDGKNASEPRETANFVLNGLAAGVSTVKAKRLTAESALARQDEGKVPSFGGQFWNNGTCEVGGAEVFEMVSVEESAGQANFTVGASEALVVYLQ